MIGVPGVTGAPDNSGAPPPAFQAILKALSAGGGAPKGFGKGSRGGQGSRGLEKPSLARSAAISRRLNGNASKGPELKGL